MNLLPYRGVENNSQQKPSQRSANKLRGNINRNHPGGKLLCHPNTDGNRWIEVPARNSPESRDHHGQSQAMGQSDANEPDAAMGVTVGNDGSGTDKHE